MRACFAEMTERTKLVKINGKLVSLGYFQMLACLFDWYTATEIKTHGKLVSGDHVL